MGESSIDVCLFLSLLAGVRVVCVSKFGRHVRYVVVLVHDQGCVLRELGIDSVSVYYRCPRRVFSDFSHGVHLSVIERFEMATSGAGE